MNKNTFATRKRRMNYSRKVIGEEKADNYQESSNNWIKGRMERLKKTVNARELPQVVKQNQKSNKS